MYLKPSEIFFSQDSINNVFDKNSSHRYKPIGETLDALCEQRCSTSGIPTISVMKRDNKWYTADNRRLWVFRHLERLGKCEEIYVRETYYISSSKFTTYNGGVSIEVRGSPGGYWYRKASVRKRELQKVAIITPDAPIEITSDGKENLPAAKEIIPFDKPNGRLAFQELNENVPFIGDQLECTYMCIKQNDMVNGTDTISTRSENSENMESQDYENKGFNSSSESLDTPVSGSTDITKDMNANICIIDENSVAIDMTSCDNGVETYSEIETVETGKAQPRTSPIERNKALCKKIAITAVVVIIIFAVLIPVVAIYS